MGFSTWVGLGVGVGPWYGPPRPGNPPGCSEFSGPGARSV